MHTKYLIGILLLLRQALAFGQCASEQYYTIGNDTWVTAKIIEDIKGGFTYNFWGATIDTLSIETSSDREIWILKNDSCGKRVWKKNFGFNSSSLDDLVDVIWTPDSNLLVLGYGEYTGQGGIYSGTLFKITPEGEVLWKQAYGGRNGLVPMSVAYNPYRNTYIISGRIERYLSGGLNRAYVFEVDSIGNLLQEKDIFLNGDSLLADRKMLRLENVAVLKDSTLYGLLSCDSNYMIKMLPDFSVKWVRTAVEITNGPSSNKNSFDTRFNNDSQYFVFDIPGKVKDIENRIGRWLVKIDTEGAIIDQSIFVGYGQSSWGDGMNLSNNGYIFWSDSLLVYDQFVAPVLLKSVSKGSNYNHRLNYVIQLRNGSYAGIGATDAHSQNKYVEVFTMQTGIDGRFVGLIPDQTKSLPITVYPNPSQGVFTFEAIDVEQTLATVWNVNGKVVFKAELTNGSINLSNQPDGLYVLQLTTSEGKLLSTQKISIVK
jgi:hypothetical protein